MTGCLAGVTAGTRPHAHAAASAAAAINASAARMHSAIARARQQQRRRESNERAVGRTVYFDYYDANGGRHTRFVGDGTVVEATQRRFLVDVIRSASNDLGPHDRIWIPKAGC